MAESARPIDAEDPILAAQRRLDVARAALPAARTGLPSAPARRHAESLEEVLRRVADGPWVSDEDVARYESQRERERRLERLADAGVDEHLTEEMLARIAADDIDATPALDLVRRWVAYQRGADRPQGPRPILGLLGERGRGKTVAAAWLLASEGGRYVHAEDLCRLHAARYGEERERCQRLLRTGGVLVIDELGTEEDSQRATAALYDVVDRRQGRRLTLLLGNVSVRRGQPGSPQPLVERYDSRTLDRLRSVASLVELQGPSLRRGSL